MTENRMKKNKRVISIVQINFKKNLLIKKDTKNIKVEVKVQEKAEVEVRPKVSIEVDLNHLNLILIIKKEDQIIVKRNLEIVVELHQDTKKGPLEKMKREKVKDIREEEDIIHQV